MIRTSQAHLNVAAATHPGSAGRQNEDRFAVASFRLSESDPTPSVFAIVSDGIGGHRAGEVAAEMAVESISHWIAQSDAGQPLEILDHAIREASEAIAASARDDTHRLGMGTTCTCAWVIGDQLFTGSVGDSRIYLLRAGTILQLTVDHTWIQEAMEKGVLKPEQVRNHPNQHVIRRYLGSSRTPQVDVRIRLAKDETDTQSRAHQGMHLHQGDILLLCTDGLTDTLTDNEILATVHGHTVPGKNLHTAVQALVSLAVSRGGVDNITAVLMSPPDSASSQKKKGVLSRFFKA